MGGGYFWANLSLMKDIANRFTIGVAVSNLFNMQHGTTPCFDYAGVGCYPYGSAGTSGPGNQYVYQNVTQTPRVIEVFLTAKLQQGVPH